ncbi:uncharacterized protein LACBIDRAFT_335161 [Laccaria bicolor S238N-H82]|uniref:Predicted protein n=1 Tax=Laccaria bicolor (strain S238N-H82 / ATCC MYA-4686) TaxID=486041 RepID=B0E1J6_LACBS|nr:uncharacterized protein LACBIDRAFT_335161 [Laccaria bicolor S238N-H82]EDQ99251.1 predicted protein [Laccaria bicolor S238N-H82]|eukprot:XP_001890061.1 predicted protein [Laccaria bicolor S238N-H82]
MTVVWGLGLIGMTVVWGLGLKSMRVTGGSKKKLTCGGLRICTSLLTFLKKGLYYATKHSRHSHAVPAQISHSTPAEVMKFVFSRPILNCINDGSCEIDGSFWKGTGAWLRTRLIAFRSSSQMHARYFHLSPRHPQFSEIPTFDLRPPVATAFVPRVNPSNRVTSTPLGATGSLSKFTHSSYYPCAQQSRKAPFGGGYEIAKAISEALVCQKNP